MISSKDGRALLASRVATGRCVVKVFTTKYKVNPQSMKAYGVGQLAPVARNTTDEGRAKNPRVELVEQ